MVSDKDVISKAQTGDEKAFEELYRRFYKIAYFYALKVCKNHTDAQDVAQNALLDVRRYIKDLRNVNYFRPWLYKIVSHQCSKTFRKAKDVHLDNFEVLYDVYNEDKQMDYDPNKKMRFESDREVLMHCIDALSAEQRECIILFYLEQFSLEEIAEITRTPLGTIKSRLSTSRKKLLEDMRRYERIQGIPVNLHALDALLIVALKEGAEALTMPTLSFLNKCKNVKLKSFSQFGIVAKTAIVGCVSAASVGTVVAITQTLQSNTIEQPVKMVQKEQSLKFEPVEYNGNLIKTARDAYFTLRNFACCEEELLRKDKLEIENIKPVYESLKKSQFYKNERLSEISWEVVFESIM